MDGPNLFRELIKRGEFRDASAQASTPAGAREFMKASYPQAVRLDVFDTGHDQPTPVDALGSMSGDTSNQDQDDANMDTIMVDATLFDEKVRQLVQSAGQYNAGYKQAAVRAGLMKRVDPELLGAVQRLQKNAPLLNRAVALTKSRLAKQGRSGSASGSASGNASGSYTRHAIGETRDDGNTSGSASGSVSGAASKVERSTVVRALAGHIADRLRVMRGEA